MTGHEVKNGCAFSFIGTGANNTLRFVQEDVGWAGRSRRWFSRDTHIVARLHDRRKIPDEMAVDRNLAVSNKSLAGPTGSITRRGQKPI
jgi:hypothetical protein